MSSSEILQLSKVLFSQLTPKDFPMISNVIGRAYYSCFHKLSEVVREEKKWIESENVKGGMHEKLISRLDNHDLTDKDMLKLIAKIKKDIILLKKKRVVADYKLEVETSIQDANYCILTAVNLHKMLDDL